MLTLDTNDETTPKSRNTLDSWKISAGRAAHRPRDGAQILVRHSDRIFPGIPLFVGHGARRAVLESWGYGLRGGEEGEAPCQKEGR